MSKRADEVVWMDFETRMRKTVTELVAPLIDRSQDDRISMQKMEKYNLKTSERLNLIEIAVFKTKQTVSIFDEIEARLLEFDIRLRRDLEAFQCDVKQKFVEQNTRVFELDKRIQDSEVMKKQFEVFISKQSAYDEQMLKFKEDVSFEITSLKQQFNTDYYEVNNEIQSLKNQITVMNPEITNLTQKIAQIQVQNRADTIRVDEILKKVIELGDSKQDSRKYRDDQKNLLEAMNKIVEKNDEQVNQVRTLENWIEKYEPLKIQHLITDTLSFCLSSKAKEKLAEYDLQMCDTLRGKILKDFGNPKMKEKALDLIARLENECLIMNETEPNQKSVKKARVHHSTMEANQYQPHTFHQQQQQKPHHIPISLAAAGIEDDEESENIEQFKEQIYNETTELVHKIDLKLTQSLKDEVDKIIGEREMFQEKLIKKVDEVTVYQNELKDEQDRQGQRILDSHKEMLQLHKGISLSFKKLKLEHAAQAEDQILIGNLIQMVMDCIQLICTYLDAQLQSSNEPLKQETGLILSHQRNQSTSISSHQLNSELLSKGIDALKRCQIQLYKRNQQTRRLQLNQPLDISKMQHAKNRSISDMKMNSSIVHNGHSTDYQSYGLNSHISKTSLAMEISEIGLLCSQYQNKGVPSMMAGETKIKEHGKGFQEQINDYQDNAWVQDLSVDQENTYRPIEQQPFVMNVKQHGLSTGRDIKKKAQINGRIISNLTQTGRKMARKGYESYDLRHTSNNNSNGQSSNLRIVSNQQRNQKGKHTKTSNLDLISGLNSPIKKQKFSIIGLGQILPEIINSSQMSSMDNRQYFQQ